MTSLSLPSGHTLYLRTEANGGSSWTEVSLDDGPWLRSRIASLHKLTSRWLDVSAADIPALWEWTTGEALGWRVCEGCGERKPDVRAVEGSDEVWCRNCRGGE